MSPHESWRRHASPRSYSLELTARTAPAEHLPAAVLHDVVTSEAAFAVSRDGRVSAWNAALEQLTGISAASALGRSCHAGLASISAGDGAWACWTHCPLAFAHARPQATGRVPFVVRTPAGPRPAELVTIAGVGNELLHLVEEVRAPRGEDGPGRSTLDPRRLGARAQDEAISRPGIGGSSESPYSGPMPTIRRSSA